MAEDFPGALLHFQTPEPQKNGMQVRIETIRRDRDDMLLKGRFAKTFSFSNGFVLDEGLIVNILCRDVHESEIAGSFMGKDILIGDGLHMFFHVCGKELVEDGDVA
jgi:hypothetical protein